MIKDNLLFKESFVRYPFFIICLSFALVINGAIPFLMIPTLGQALWTTGFSLSFLNDSLFSIYATNFGVPEPAAIAFGLVGAWTSALFIWLGLHPSDAYSSMVLLWLVVAFVSAFKIGRLLNLSFYQSSFVAIVWLSMPVIRGHAAYSMLSLGIALLSFYFFSAIKLFLYSSEKKYAYCANSFYYFIAVLIAVFMDGYTFMMFAVGSSILFCVVYFSEPTRRQYLIKLALPIHIISFLIAYLAFALYVGKSQFEPADLDFFRGWGADLTFFFIPTEGFYWLADKFNFSIKRSSSDWFGDASVWTTTFFLPLFLSTIWSFKHSLGLNKTLAYGMFMIAIFAFYMSLGPSLKLNSSKPDSVEISSSMPLDYAVVPTGSHLLSKYLPGFKSMRASYRWVALGVFSLWLILIMSLVSKQQKTRHMATFLVLVIFIFNLPDLPKKWQANTNLRNMFHKVDAEFVTELSKDLNQGELVAFLPWRNDFFVNYLASRLKIKAYNMGGDKNLQAAQLHWPETMQQFQMATIDEDFADRIALLLLDRAADVVVMPYIDLSNPYTWPGKIQYHQEIKVIEEKLRDYEWLEIIRGDYYSTVRIRNGYDDFEKYISLLFPFEGNYPFLIKERSSGITRILKKGWHQMEASHVWSGKISSLNLPVPEECQLDECFAVVTFSVFGAHDGRPVEILLTDKNESLGYKQSLTVSDSNEYQVAIPLRSQQSFQEIGIEIPEATSPQELADSADNRILGIALNRIELKIKN